MKTESMTKPKKVVVNYYDKYEKCLVTFNTNIQEEQRPIPEEEGKTETVYIYDSYVIKTWYRKTLKEDILKDYDKWLEYAKQSEYDEYAKIVRTERDKLLQESDKEMVLDRLKLDILEEINMGTIVQGIKDFFTSLKEIRNSPMAEYRQKLRDIPQQEGFPYNVEFPVKPETDKKEE